MFNSHAVAVRDEITICPKYILPINLVDFSGDNNYKGGAGRPPGPDQNELLLLKLDKPLNVDLPVGVGVVRQSAIAVDDTKNTTGNVIASAIGKDPLTGAGSSDNFSDKSPNQGGDMITDFSTDKISLSGAGFGSGLSAGIALNTIAPTAGAFVSGAAPSALGTSANLSYSTTAGVLSFDSDSLGSKSAIPYGIAPLHATLSGTPALMLNEIGLF